MSFIHPRTPSPQSRVQVAYVAGGVIAAVLFCFAVLLAVGLIFGMDSVRSLSVAPMTIIVAMYGLGGAVGGSYLYDNRRGRPRG